jgi:hypothetical protein
MIDRLGIVNRNKPVLVRIGLFIECPQGDSNPRFSLERAAS